MSPARITASARAHVVDNWRRLLRYCGTSAVGVVLGQTILRVCYDLFGWSGLVSNLAAFVVANIPVYFLYRGWVWRLDGPTQWRRVVLPFWLVSLAGLAVSSLAVGLVDAATDNGWFITMASVGAFGTVWVVKYAVCDRYLFGDPTEGDGLPMASLEAAEDGSHSAVVR